MPQLMTSISYAYPLVKQLAPAWYNELLTFPATDTTTSSNADARNYNGSAPVSVDGRGGLDSIYGGSGNDCLRESGSAPDLWRITDSRDPTPGVTAASLDGGYGNDKLILCSGVKGSFMLDGGFGADTFVVNGGTNVHLAGGDGADYFNFGNTFAGNAEIRDFKQGVDKLHLGPGWTLENTAPGAPASFTDGYGHHIVIDGVSHDTMQGLNHGNGNWY